MNPSVFAIPRTAEVPIGAYGVWQLPELNVSIPVYKANSYTVQKIVDTENAASIQNFGVGKLIADHAESKSNAGKGSWDIWKCRPDDTAFMIMPNETLQYRCLYVARVRVLRHGYQLDGAGVYLRLPTDIACVGCVDPEGAENYMAVFKLIGKMP